MDRAHSFLPTFLPRATSVLRTYLLYSSFFDEYAIFEKMTMFQGIVERATQRFYAGGGGPKLIQFSVENIWHAQNIVHAYVIIVRHPHLHENL